jgi:hypothetical protein
MSHVTSRRVTAQVKQPESHNPFKARDFDLMLGATNTDRQNILEARRILRQIGYEVKGDPVIHKEG